MSVAPSLLRLLEPVSANTSQHWCSNARLNVLGLACAVQRGLGLSEPAQLVAHINTHLKQEPYTLAELSSDELFGVHPNTLFDGRSTLWGGRPRNCAGIV